jgi:hypothetical protein
MAVPILPDRQFPGILLKTLLGYRDHLYYGANSGLPGLLATVGSTYFRSLTHPAWVWYWQTGPQPVLIPDSLAWLHKPGYTPWEHRKREPEVMVAVAILAAGRGTRMKSSLPKVLHSVGGVSMVERVLQGVEPLQPEPYFCNRWLWPRAGAEALAHWPGLTFVEQTEQLGTGHAVQQVIPHLEGFEGDLLVLNGDVPLLRPLP